jgi:hypothetical protein
MYTDMLAKGEMSRPAYARAAARTEQELAGAEARLIADSGTPAAAVLVAGGDIEAGWSKLSVEQRREVIKELVLQIVLTPPKKTNGWLPDGIQVQWR